MSKKKILAVVLILLAATLACSTGGMVKNTGYPAAATKILATATQTASISTVTTVTALQALWVRSASGYKSPAVGSLLAGQEVTLLGACDADGWRPVQTTSGLKGWVNADYLGSGCK